MDEQRDFGKEAVASIRRNKRETLLFYAENFNGVDLGHIRVCVPNKEGALRPTGKGITVRRDELPEFSAGVQRLADQLRALSA